MTDQAGERLARSACEHCDSRALQKGHIGINPELFPDLDRSHSMACLWCKGCGFPSNPDAAFRHGLKLERDAAADAVDVAGGVP